LNVLTPPIGGSVVPPRPSDQEITGCSTGGVKRKRSRIITTAWTREERLRPLKKRVHYGEQLHPEEEDYRSIISISNRKYANTNGSNRE
jgi:hypothetical protein